MLWSRNLFTYHFLKSPITYIHTYIHTYIICFPGATTRLEGVNIILCQRGSWSSQRWPLCAEGMSETAITQLITFSCHQNDAQYRLQLWLQHYISIYWIWQKILQLPRTHSLECFASWHKTLPPPSIPLSSVSRHTFLHNLPVLPT